MQNQPTNTRRKAGFGSLLLYFLCPAPVILGLLCAQKTFEGFGPQNFRDMHFDLLIAGLGQLYVTVSPIALLYAIGMTFARRHGLSNWQLMCWSMIGGCLSGLAFDLTHFQFALNSFLYPQTFTAHHLPYLLLGSATALFVESLASLVVRNQSGQKDFNHGNDQLKVLDELEFK